VHKDPALTQDFTLRAEQTGNWLVLELQRVHFELYSALFLWHYSTFFCFMLLCSSLLFLLLCSTLFFLLLCST